MSAGELEITPADVELMRDWIGDCQWPDLDAEELEELEPARVIAGVARHYCGGIPSFLRDVWELR